MLTKLLSRLVILACLPVLAHAAPIPVRDKEKEEILGNGQTVILGTWTWKIEGDSFGGGSGDFFWEQVSATERQLVPHEGAGWAVLKDMPFEKINRADLAK